MRVWNMMDGELPPFAVVLGCELDPGGSVGAHVQQECAEIVIVTEGRGHARVGQQSIPLSPGVVVQLPLGETLALRNGSDTDVLRYFIIKAH